MSTVPSVAIVDLLERLRADPTGNGVVWTLEHDADLNVNLVRLEPDAAMASHVNQEVDVAVIVVGGTGRLELDGRTEVLSQGVLALLPKGTRRSIAAGPDGLAYVTVHRRRSLGIGGVRRRDA